MATHSNRVSKLHIFYAICALVLVGASITSVTYGKEKGAIVRGTITLGPTCGGAVIFPQPSPSDCSDKPYATTVYFISMDGSIRMPATSNPEGLYRVKLPAGTYVIREHRDDSTDPIMVPFYRPYLTTVGPITVGDEKQVDLDLLFDTGIR
jgi:hypothetical protein